jgi:hypothetical protein
MHTRTSIVAEKAQPRRDFEKLTKVNFLFARFANARHDGPMRAFLPKSVAQLTGVLVTAIVAFGTDVDVYYAMPLGVFAGALAIFFVSLSEATELARRAARGSGRIRRNIVERVFQFLEAGLIFGRHAAAADFHRHLRRIAMQMRDQDVADDVIEQRVLVDHRLQARAQGPTMP